MITILLSSSALHAAEINAEDFAYYFPEAPELVDLDSACVRTSSFYKTESYSEISYEVHCPNAEGTINVTTTKEGSRRTHEVVADLKTTSATGRKWSSWSRVLVEKYRHKERKVTKQYEEQFVDSNNSYEVMGLSTYSSKTKELQSEVSVRKNSQTPESYSTKAALGKLIVSR
ncbi:MAG: hypothetical protein J7501_01895 [Bdellovibrio sp.]|nr:hypothetical protein [Bdellovibrio sp.]